MQDIIDTLLHYRVKEYEAKEEYKRLTRHVLQLESDLRKVCTHPDPVQVKKRNYFSDSYYDKSYTECGYCKTKYNEHTEMGYHG